MLNHVSFLDIPLVGGFIPGFVRGIEASRQHKWPLYGRVMGRLGNIPIERENIHASLSVTGKARESLEAGTSMIIFPEGGRTGNGLMKRFKKLPFHLAKQSGFDLIPVGISGMFEVNNKNAWYMGPGHVHLTFGVPIPAEKIAEMETLELRKHVFERIQYLAGQAE
jgi:1-acyl-sn-glycerol-3-phosphate acyltransferase